MAKILKGAPVAAALSETLSAQAAALKKKGIAPTLALLRAGQRPEDIAYEKSAVKRCETIGITVRRFSLPADCRREELLAAVRAVNQDDTIHGCLLFRPLPNPEDEAAACALLSPEKDADGMTAGALASVFMGKGPGYPPCAAQACIELLDFYGIPLAGKRVTVIGRSLVVGRPLAMMLQQRGATVTMCHSQTADLSAACRNAEILATAAGKAGIVNRRSVSPGQIILDAGINLDENGKLRGDVDFDAVSKTAAAITPVPGGIGAVTATVLAKHVLNAAERLRVE